MFYLDDANFNVTGLVNMSDQVVERYAYDPYGAVTVYKPDWSGTQSPTLINNTVLYTGQQLDPETCLYFCLARYYDAGLGTFVSQDPSGFSSGDINLYRYVRSTPTNATDPTGTQEMAPPTAATLPWEVYDNGDLEKEVAGLRRKVKANNGDWDLELWALKVTIINIGFLVAPNTTFGGTIFAKFTVNEKAAKEFGVKTYEIVVGRRYALNGVLVPKYYEYELADGSQFEPYPPGGTNTSFNWNGHNPGGPAVAMRVPSVSGDVDIDVLFGARCIPEDKKVKAKWLSATMVTAQARKTNKGYTVSIPPSQALDPDAMGAWLEAAEKETKKVE